MPFLTFLAQTTPPPPSGIWYPTIVGILVVVAAIALFCGSIYVLLAKTHHAEPSAVRETAPGGVGELEEAAV